MECDLLGTVSAVKQRELWSDGQRETDANSNFINNDLNIVIGKEMCYIVSYKEGQDWEDLFWDSEKLGIQSFLLPCTRLLLPHPEDAE